MVQEKFEGEPPEHLRHQEHNSTMFNQCGWCKYASGSHRFSYCVSGKCSLLKSYGPEIQWDTPCKLADASQNEIDAIEANHEYQIKGAEQSIAKHREYIIVLKHLQATAPARPALPDDRKHDHFNLKDPLAVWNVDKAEWTFGIVTTGYRHHDGCVSYGVMGISGSIYGGGGSAIPTILLREEYDFFEANPEEYDIWCVKAYNKKFNGQTLEKAPITTKGD